MHSCDFVQPSLVATQRLPSKPHSPFFKHSCDCAHPSSVAMHCEPLNPHSPFSLHCVERLHPNAFVIQRGPSRYFCSNPQLGGHILMAAPRKSLCTKLNVEHCSAVGGLGGVHTPSVQTRYFVQSDDWVQMDFQMPSCARQRFKKKRITNIFRGPQSSKGSFGIRRHIHHIRIITHFIIKNQALNLHNESTC